MPRVSRPREVTPEPVASARRVPRESNSAVVGDGRAFVEYVASRYGRRNPSFADALDIRWPRYNIDKIHTSGWHRDSIAAQLIVEAGPRRLCLVCSNPLPIGHQNRRYCGGTCKAAARHLKPTGKGGYNAMSAAERAKMRELYEAGLTITQVGWEMRRSPSAVARALGEMGVAMRRAGPRRAA